MAGPPRARARQTARHSVIHLSHSGQRKMDARIKSAHDAIGESTIAARVKD